MRPFLLADLKTIGFIMSQNYHNRFFRSVANSADGEVGAETEFHYRQDGDVIWATYSGGEVRFGTLVGIVEKSNNLRFSYSHVNVRGEIRSGTCTAVPESLSDGRLRLHETWQWIEGGEMGQSVVEEILQEGGKFNSIGL